MLWPERGQVSTVHPIWAAGPSKLGQKTKVLGALENGSADVQTPKDPTVIQRRAAYIDVSATSREPLRYGQETLLINSSIMSQRYSPIQAAWMVDLDLPTY